MSMSDVADDVTPTDKEVIASFMKQHADRGYRGLRDYASRQAKTLVAVPGRGMVDLRDFSAADEAAYEVSLEELMSYAEKFRARINVQSRRLRELGLMTPKGTIVLPEGQFQRNPAELSETDMQALEQATSEQLAMAYYHVTHCVPRAVPCQPAPKPAPVRSGASRHDRRPISSFVPPAWPKNLDRDLARLV